MIRKLWYDSAQPAQRTVGIVTVRWKLPATNSLFSTMITSRGLNLLRIIYKNSQNKAITKNLQSVRLSHGHGTYREYPKEDKNWVWAAEIMGGFMWWWIFWHFWHDFGHIVGEFPYPDASKWTDEELGIPPDDYEEPATRIA